MGSKILVVDELLIDGNFTTCIDFIAPMDLANIMTLLTSCTVELLDLLCLIEIFLADLTN